MGQLNEIFALAVQHQRRGDLQKAEVLYRQILEANPIHWYICKLAISNKFKILKVEKMSFLEMRRPKSLMASCLFLDTQDKLKSVSFHIMTDFV